MKSEREISRPYSTGNRKSPMAVCVEPEMRYCNKVNCRPTNVTYYPLDSIDARDAIKRLFVGETLAKYCRRSPTKIAARRRGALVGGSAAKSSTRKLQ